MTIDEQIEIKFSQLAQLSKERASEIIERIADKPAEQQLSIIRMELSMLRDTYIESNIKIDLDDITSRFLKALESKDE
jgi:hypothetical protein